LIYYIITKETYMASTGGVKLGSTYDEARTRKINAEAEISELELDKIKGALVLAEDVAKAWMDVLGALKGKLLSIPTKAAPIVAAESDAAMCQSILEDTINEALQELSNYDPKINAGKSKPSEAALEDGNENSSAATKVKRGRVGRPTKTARLAD
jgi:hypothetical protein